MLEHPSSSGSFDGAFGSVPGFTGARSVRTVRLSAGPNGTMGAVEHVEVISNPFQALRRQNAKKGANKKLKKDRFAKFR
ncbi:hypothetical protein [Sulfidibacter corallicola]|uniref:Uncharacterized protein n=1 Tax=Sulfidibacter corallicola TaxID=2818388 RepID=A0A8A4TN29_SULCO|nr:hypothetical protein [Sulfidibacter corallicola]QTD50301.1 hypothetical protein J3U87_32350 [Sulfidibacter corallicola]